MSVSDIDECEMDGTCDADQQCVNYVGGFTCVATGRVAAVGSSIPLQRHDVLEE